MCGIAGYIGSKTFYPSKIKINSCLNLMKLRGPDSQDINQFQLKQNKILFCASRLSIIDISERSNQPIEDEEGILSFNGEIYNYLEIKKNLIRKKIKFKTKSDTEVLLKFLNYYGVKELNQIHGMWSFAYFSKKLQKFFLCRDKFGEKPVFFSLENKKKSFLFGSNVNYIRKLSLNDHKVDKDKIYNYLKYGFRSVYSDNKTFFEKINFVKPGQIIQIDKDFKFKNFSYTNYGEYKPKIINYNFGKKILQKKINEMIPKTFRSDVPIAFLLSGGVDSSIISYLAKKKLKNTKFYSLKQKDKLYNESINISLLKKKLNLRHEYISTNDLQKNFKIIDDLIKDIGFPLLSTTNLAINKICQKVKKDGYKVLISGNGGDEIFSGYYAHHMSYLISIKNTPKFKKNLKNWKNTTKPFIRTQILKNLNLFEKNLLKKGFNFESNIYEKYFKTKNKKKIFYKKDKKKIKDIFIQHLDNDLFYDTLPAQTHTIDNITMHNSIESRMPYLSDDFYLLRNSMSKHFLIRNGLAKYILRDVFKKKIPSSILFNPEKTGFFLPLKETININSKKFLNVITKNKYINSIINLRLIEKKISDDSLTQQDQKFIFLLYNAASFMNFYSK